VLAVTACGSNHAAVHARPAQRTHEFGAAIDFLTPARGFLVTRGGVLRRTADGGKHWQVVRDGLRLVALRFLTPRRGFALSERGRLLSTRDGGRSWSVLRRLRASEPIVGAFAFPTGRDGWAVAEDRLFRTRDGGRTWRRLRSPRRRLTLYIGGISFVDARRGYVACGGQPATIMQAKEVYASTDGGATWRLRACVRFVRDSGCPGRIEADGHVSGLDFRDVHVGLLITDRGGIARTADGGRRWTDTLVTDDQDTVMSTSWASSTTVYALLYHGARLLRSEDSGRHWRRL
jgi:photosystem II stability/assembly factor-like uncharacterized protein